MTKVASSYLARSRLRSRSHTESLVPCYDQLHVALRMPVFCDRHQDNNATVIQHYMNNEVEMIDECDQSETVECIFVEELKVLAVAG